MFIGRRQDGTIYGLWTVRQWAGQEELPDNHAEVVAFVTQPKRKTGEAKPTSPIIDPRIRAGA